MGIVGLGMDVGNTVLADSIGDMTIMFFYSIFQTSVGFSYVGKVEISFWEGPFVDNVFLVMMGFYLWGTQEWT